MTKDGTAAARDVVVHGTKVRRAGAVETRRRGFTVAAGIDVCARP
jgi:hypothetical protein